MNNIEIKALLPDPPQTRRAIDVLGAVRQWTKSQRDVFFQVASGYLKLRTHDGSAPGELIAYRREPGTAPRASDYDIVEIPLAASLEAALTRSLGVRGVVLKTRTLFLWRHTRIHLDAVDGLGSFLELETVVQSQSRAEAESETQEAMLALNLPRHTLLDRTYLEFLENPNLLSQ